LRFYLISGTIAFIKKTDSKCWLGCVEKGTIILLVGMQIM
jgi:hypothetical protein